MLTLAWNYTETIEDVALPLVLALVPLQKFSNKLKQFSN